MSNTGTIRRHTRLFFALSFGLSWAFWILAAILSTEGASLPSGLLHYAGGLMSVTITAALIYLRHTSDFRRDFWRRAIGFRRIGFGWYGVVLLTAPLLTALGAMVDPLLGGEDLTLEAAERFVRQPLGPHCISPPTAQLQCARRLC